MTNRIHKLEPEIANQIAAGEVIERPANACKELVENALDAGAQRITIDVEEGGKKLIRVRDDGCGMSAGDAVLALQRHATSKLREAADLHSIRTLGFRGEALPSIAAVSRFELTTREADAEAGTHIEVAAGTVIDVSEVGCAPGTEIAIHQLFYNTPARYKFLKSDAAEAGRIAEMVGHLALAHPHVAFRLRHNGSETMRVEAGGNALNAVVCVLGRETARQMLPIAASASENSENQIQVTGFVGRPQTTRSNRNGQVFFVNGRVVKSRSLQHAVAAAYEGLVHQRDRFPLAIIFIQIPPNAVDVNVHPTKSEVRFAREWEVHHAVRVAVRETLVAAQLAPEWGLANQAATPFGALPHETGSTPFPAQGTPLSGDAAPGGSPLPAPYPQQTPSTPPADYRGYYQPVAPRGGNIADFHAAYQAAQGSTPQGSVQGALPELEAPPADAGKLKLRPLAQISNNAYILCEAEDGLYIVCQHRAHERILADQALAAAEGKQAQSQRLVIPYTVEVGPRAAAALEENAALLQDLGFEIEAFGGSSVLVRAVPAAVAHKDYETAFTDLLDELIAGHGGRDLQERRRQLLTMLACKNAIKAGDPLGPEQINNLIEELLLVPNPSICPHGQPILIKISTLELNKKFEREYASR
ncbi:MAG TPA: DNA mismatch repair endonuclease MutL [Abditibacteriaceae bacterium]|nr:DNA mismatch repair endonuclease MutL [Abditibacteriaceae bacterium]